MVGRLAVQASSKEYSFVICAARAQVQAQRRKHGCAPAHQAVEGMRGAPFASSCSSEGCNLLQTANNGRRKSCPGSNTSLAANTTSSHGFRLRQGARSYHGTMLCAHDCLVERATLMFWSCTRRESSLACTNYGLHSKAMAASAAALAKLTAALSRAVAVDSSE